MQFIASFDKFGATYKPKLKQEQKNYKTVLGGAISLIIYLLSFIYFCYKVYLFGSNQMNPVQSLAQEFKENYSLEADDHFIKFSIQGSKINPFNRTNQILVPMIMHQGVDIRKDFMYFGPDFIYDDEQIDQDKQYFSPKNLSLSNGNSDHPSTIIIILQICDAKIHKNCSDSSTIQNFFNQTGLLIQTEIITQQYNSFSKQIEEMTSKAIFALDPTVLFYQRVIMQAQILNIDQTPLLASYDRHQFFSDYTVQTQSLGTSYKSGFEGGVFATELSMSQVAQKKVVQFVKISQVLADVGSIFSTLMLFSIIISSINETWMEEEIMSQVIGIYYPQFSQLTIKRFLFIGPIKQVMYKNRIINLEKFKQFYEKAQQIAMNKLTVYSNIYQISRLQFALQSLMARQELIDLHRQGIQLNLLFDQNVLSQRENQILDPNQNNENNELEDLHHTQKLDLKFKDEDYDILDQQSVKSTDSRKSSHITNNEQIEQVIEQVNS